MATAEDPTENFHPAVRLLLKRMETDPEEFANTTRWEKPLSACRDYCNQDERDALTEKYKLIKLDAIHVEIMRIMTKTESPPTAAIDVQAHLEAMKMAMAAQQLQQANQQNAMRQMAAKDLNNAQLYGQQPYGIGGYAASQSTVDRLDEAIQRIQNAALPGKAYFITEIDRPKRSLKDRLRDFGLNLAGKPKL